MKKLILITLIFLVSCSTLQTKELSTTKIYNKTVSIEQFDSIKKSELIKSFDSIPIKNKYDKWIYEYYYLRDSLVMRAFKNGDSINIMKKINK